MLKRLISAFFLVIVLATSSFAADNYQTSGMKQNPYDWQVQNEVKRLQSDDADTRAEAIEKLGFLRAYAAADAVVGLLDDPAAATRREAAIYLGLCGGVEHLDALMEAMSDEDWSVRQSAHVALMNLTGQDLPFDALADKAVQDDQRNDWKEWLDNRPSDAVPPSIIALLDAELPEQAEDFVRCEQGVRALGVFGSSDDATAIIRFLEPYIGQNELEPVRSGHHHGSSLRTEEYVERIFVQVAIRSLGQLGGDKATETLIALLDNPQLAFYAADALGDIGSAKVAEALIRVFPEYAITPEGRTNWKNDTKYYGIVPKFHDDDAPKYTATDRVPRTAYAIVHALIRCELPEGEALADILGDMIPGMVATMPSMHDTSIFYEPRSYNMMVAYLLEHAGLRQDVVHLFMNARGEEIALEKELPHLTSMTLLSRFKGQEQWNTVIFPALATPSEDNIQYFTNMLDDKQNYARISAARTLINMDAKSAAEAVYERLNALPDDIERGYVGRFETEEFNVESGRYKEAYIRALGKLGGTDAHVALLKRLCLSEDNNLEIRYAAAQALADIASESALEALRFVDHDNEYRSVQLVAREALAMGGVEPFAPEIPEAPDVIEMTTKVPSRPEDIDAVVFLRGEHNPGNMKSIPNTLQAYTTTDAGPTTRLGRNIFMLSPVTADGEMTQLTHFEDGYVADLEVSFDGKRIIFCRREQDNPWWHIFEMNADGTNLRQITDGPYHDVQPNYLGDGRIVFSTSRIGVRDEYHGYLCTGLAVCNPDGSDIHCLSVNLGRDAEPVIDPAGRILFTRLELFYSRMKTEWNLLACQTDGTGCVTLYGPERRDFWNSIQGGWSLSKPRHRVLRIAQPLPFDGDRYLINSFEGPMILGPGRFEDRLLQQDNSMAITTPWPVNENTLLVSAGKRPWKEKKGKLVLDRKGNKQLDIMAAVDHGLYWMDVASGELTPIFNKPETNEFEARPLAPRRVPPVSPESPLTRRNGRTGTMFCQSVYNTQHPEVKMKGRYIRVVEGLPTVQRHQTHRGGTVWKNHGGATARVWGTLPLAADGSFKVELPSDRMFHFQVLDSDRRVVSNELIWQYVRPGETRGCIGCHEPPDQSPPPTGTFPKATYMDALKAVPRGDDLRYQAKMWWKGTAPWPREERMRTVNAVNLLGRP